MTKNAPGGDRTHDSRVTQVYTMYISTMLYQLSHKSKLTGFSPILMYSRWVLSQAAFSSGAYAKQQVWAWPSKATQSWLSMK